MLAEKIVEQLRARVFPQSAAELARAMPGTQLLEIEQACHDLRSRQQVGRNGSDTPSSPYRFYLRRVNA